MIRSILFSLALTFILVEARKVRVEVYEIREKPNDKYNDERDDQDRYDNVDNEKIDIDYVDEPANEKIMRYIIGRPDNEKSVSYRDKSLYQSSLKSLLSQLLQRPLKAKKLRTPKHDKGLLELLTKLLGKVTYNSNNQYYGSGKPDNEYLDYTFRGQGQAPVFVYKQDIEDLLKSRQLNRQYKLQSKYGKYVGRQGDDIISTSTVPPPISLQKVYLFDRDNEDDDDNEE